MAGDCLIDQAVSDDAPALSALALCSKARWGYSQKFMSACVTDLIITTAPLVSHELVAFIAIEGEPLLGFYALEVLGNEVCELDALFVEPEHIGRGIGRALLEHAQAQAIGLSARVIFIQGDPNAAAFYEAVGARHLGTENLAVFLGGICRCMHSMRLPSAESQRLERLQ